MSTLPTLNAHRLLPIYGQSGPSVLFFICSQAKKNCTGHSVSVYVLWGGGGVPTVFSPWSVFRVKCVNIIASTCCVRTLETWKVHIRHSLVHKRGEKAAGHYLFRVVCRNLLVCRQKRRRTKNDMRHAVHCYIRGFLQSARPICVRWLCNR